MSAADTVRVYDTWGEGKKGTIHFDVMTTDEATALKLAKEYLAGIGEAEAAVTTEECQFCHSEPLVMFSAEQQKLFREQGGFILPLPA
jgi:heterodisulfide reductase subunit B